MLGQRYYHAAGTDDPHFFPSNLAHRVAEKLLMVQCNVGNDTHFGFDDISRIQSPAHTDFQYCHFDRLLGEVLKRNRSHHFKKTRMPWQLALLD